MFDSLFQVCSKNEIQRRNLSMRLTRFYTKQDMTIKRNMNNLIEREEIEDG